MQCVPKFQVFVHFVDYGFPWCYAIHIVSDPRSKGVYGFTVLSDPYPFVNGVLVLGVQFPGCNDMVAVFGCADWYDLSFV